MTKQEYKMAMCCVKLIPDFIELPLDISWELAVQLHAEYEELCENIDIHTDQTCPPSMYIWVQENQERICNQVGHSDQLLNEEQFVIWIKSDNVIKTGPNEYRTQCNQYAKAMTYQELRQYFKNEYEER